MSKKADESTSTETTKKPDKQINTSKIRNEKHSHTYVNIDWTGPRGVHSFRCNDKLWSAFVQETKARGNSVCHMLEAIIAGVLGVLTQDVYKSRTITIENLNVQRVVRKHRRVSHEYDVESANKYDSKTGRWVYEADAPLNENGHAAGCGCKVCHGGCGYARA